MHYNPDLTLKNIEKELNTGDILVVEGKPSFLTKLIKLVTGSGFTHTAMLVKIDGVSFVVETRAKTQYSYNMMPADWWFERYGDEDTYIGKMPNTTNNHETTGEQKTKLREDKIKELLLNPKESLRPYSITWLAITYILQNWFGFFRPCIKRIFGSVKPMVCSTMIQEIWERANIIEKTHFQSPGGIVNILGGREKLTPIDYCKSRKTFAPKSTSTRKYLSSFSTN